MTIVSVWVYGIRQKGLKGYLKHFFEPFPVMLPLNILEELIKPITLALRLFGNIFAGGIMLALITLMPVYILWAPNLLWKGFDMAIGVIQAFIFALLTVLYFAMAGAGHGDHEHDDHDEHESRADVRVRVRGADPRSGELTDRSLAYRGNPEALEQRRKTRRESQWQQKELSSWPVPSSVVASPSPVARSAPVSVTVWPVRPTSRASLVSPRPRVDSRPSSS